MINLLTDDYNQHNLID